MNKTAETSSRNLAREKDKIKALVADISHQTKTPIANLLLYSELLQEEALPPSTEANVDTLHAQAKKLQFLIDALVKLSRLENGIISLSPKRTALQPLLQSAAEQYAAKAAEKGLALHLYDTEASAVFDPKWTAEALTNLIDNAIKYTPRGGSVRVDLFRQGKKAVIRISDTGIGIPAEDLPHIFDRFYRVDKARSRETGGTGLGLSIVKQIVLMHDGDITASSVENEGTTFTIELPALAKKAD